MALSSILKFVAGTALVGLASAATNSTTNSTMTTTTPTGLTPSTDTLLLVAFNNASVILSTAGRNATLSSVSQAPVLGINAIPAGINSGEYLALMVDIDSGSNTSEILHWLSAGNSIYNASLGPGGFPFGFTNNTAATVPYRNPSPPAGAGAHRYVQYLFSQPTVPFVMPAAYANYSSTNRTLFNVARFAAAASLGSPLAANYMYVANTTTASRTSSSSTSSKARVVTTITSDIATTRLITGANGVVSTQVSTITELLTSTAAGGVGPLMTAPPMAWQAAAGLVGAFAVLV